MVKVQTLSPAFCRIGEQLAQMEQRFWGARDAVITISTSLLPLCQHQPWTWTWEKSASYFYCVLLLVLPVRLFRGSVTASTLKVPLIWKYQISFNAQHFIHHTVLVYSKTGLEFTQILSVGKRIARKITRPVKNSHLLRQLALFSEESLFLGWGMSSDVKKFSCAHE